MTKIIILAPIILLVLSSCAGSNPNPGERTVDMGWTSGKYEKPLEILKPTAEKGEPWAQLRLGIFLENGWGIEKNKKEAFNWYKKAALQTAEGEWADGLLVGATGKSGYFNQNSDALIAQFNLAQIYFFDEEMKDLTKSYLLVTNVIKKSGGKSVFFCCEFSGGRYFAQRQFITLLSKIEKEMSVIELEQAKKQSQSWVISDL